MRPCRLWRFTFASLLGGLLLMQIPQTVLAEAPRTVLLESIREEGSRLEVRAWSDRDGVACRVVVTYSRATGFESISIPAVANGGQNRWVLLLPDRVGGPIDVGIIVDDGTPF